MKALVATINYLLLVDLQSGAVNIIESNRPEYYGISWWENTNSLVLSHSGLANDSLLDIQSYIDSEKGYLSFGKAQMNCFLSQPHQILCAPDNHVITTNTGRNCITLYDLGSGYYKDIRINDIRWDRLGKDNPCGEHFNSIYLKSNRLYVLAHRFTRASHILEFSYPECALLERYEVQQRSGLHNIWVDDSGNMIACHSNAGELIEVKSNETIWASDSSFYSRGLAATADVIIVGDSEINSRENRKYAPSELWVIDRKTLSTLDYIPLGSFGSVHEVRILDIEDDAHHGKIFSGLANLKKSIEEREESLNQLRKAKLKRSQECQMNYSLLQEFKCILGGWAVDSEGWIAPKKEGFTLALTKTTLDDSFIVSLDYAFPLSHSLTSQHVSIVVGYRGNDDSNMLAILVEYSVENNATQIELWKNKQGVWQSESLLSLIPKQGKLSVSRMGNQLIISCSDLPSVSREFDSEELEGSIGVRCLGSKFNNFTITALSQVVETINPRSKIQKVWEKSGMAYTKD